MGIMGVVNKVGKDIDNYITRKEGERGILKSAASMALELRAFKILLEDISYAGDLCKEYPDLFEIPCEELHIPWKPLEDRAEFLRNNMFKYPKQVAALRGEDWTIYSVIKNFSDPTLNALQDLRLWSAPHAYLDHTLDWEIAVYVKEALKETPNKLSSAVKKIPGISKKGETALEDYCKDLLYKTKSEWKLLPYLSKKGFINRR